MNRRQFLRRSAAAGVLLLLPRPAMIDPAGTLTGPAGAPSRVFLPMTGNGWPPDPPGPTLNPPVRTGDFTYTLTWSADPSALSYTLQEAASPDFSAASTVYTGPATTWASGVKTPGTYCYRVCAERAGGSASPWSAAQSITVECPALLRDDFSNPNSGWLTWNYDASTGGYVDGEYFIRIKRANYLTLTTPGRIMTDFRVGVDARSLAPGQGAYGLVFGLAGGSYYDFEVAYGYFALRRYDKPADRWATLVEWSPSPAIRTGTDTNRLEAARTGDDIRLWANGQLLTTLTDAALLSGTVGLVADAAAVDYEARFDNYALYDGTCG